MKVYRVYLTGHFPSNDEGAIPMLTELKTFCEEHNFFQEASNHEGVEYLIAPRFQGYDSENSLAVLEQCNAMIIAQYGREIFISDFKAELDKATAYNVQVYYEVDIRKAIALVEYAGVIDTEAFPAPQNEPNTQFVLFEAESVQSQELILLPDEQTAPEPKPAAAPKPPKVPKAKREFVSGEEDADTYNHIELKASKKVGDILKEMVDEIKTKLKIYEDYREEKKSGERDLEDHFDMGQLTAETGCNYRELSLVCRTLIKMAEFDNVTKAVAKAAKTPR